MKWIKDILYIILLVVGVALTFFYMSWQNERKNRIRIESNFFQMQKLDSTKIAEIELSKIEIKNYLEFENKNLKTKLYQDGIKLKRIEKIISQVYKVQDTVLKTVSANNVLTAIKDNKPIKSPFKDENKCFLIEGNITYDGKDSLNINITNRQLTDSLNNITVWDRKQTRWLFGFKSKLFGKKYAKTKIYNNCGELQTIIIEKK